MGKQIYTIGYSGHLISQFLETVKSFHIESIADVRRFPNSKQNIEYNQGVLRVHLVSINVGYFWLGEKLGGFRTGGYEKYVDTDPFKSELIELKNLAEDKRTAIMCLEKMFTGCHRRFIANVLAQQGWEVIHILEKELSITHQIQESLFH